MAVESGKDKNHKGLEKWQLGPGSEKGRSPASKVKEIKKGGGFREGKRNLR